MKIISTLLTSAIILTATTVLALPEYPVAPYSTSWDGSANVLTSVFKNIGATEINPYTAFTEPDAYWKSSSTSESVIATLLIEIAGYKNYNSFGIYDKGSNSNKLEIFQGADSAKASEQLSITQSGTSFNFAIGSTTKTFSSNEFGFYLQNKTGAIFYSDSSLNPDNTNAYMVDHMFSYSGATDKDNKVTVKGTEYAFNADTWLLAFEDLKGVFNPTTGKLTGGSDFDFNDMIVLVDNITTSTVPEPGTIVLLGAGLLGLGFYGRRRSQK